MKLLILPTVIISSKAIDYNYFTVHGPWNRLTLKENDRVAIERQEKSYTEKQPNKNWKWIAFKLQ